VVASGPKTSAARVGVRGRQERAQAQADCLSDRREPPTRDEVAPLWACQDVKSYERGSASGGSPQAGVGVSELSNGDIIRADRDRRTAAVCYVVWGAFATWVSVGRASAMWSLWMADANFDVQRDVQLFGWLELHCAGTVDGTKHVHITATA